eukprot:2250865-Karenia_brevis.AAC.1
MMMMMMMMIRKPFGDLEVPSSATLLQCRERSKIAFPEAFSHCNGVVELDTSNFRKVSGCVKPG